MRLSGDDMEHFKIVNKNHSKYLIAVPFENMGVKHFISTRIGGYSTGDYLNFNLGVFTNDINVNKNIQKAFDDNNMNLNNIVYLKQTHSDIVHVVNADNINEIRGKEGDSLITKDKNIPIGVFTADCVSCLVYEGKNNIVASVHAGWKGTYNKILYKTINKMINELNADKDNIYIALGPAIANCCFEVSKDVADKFTFVNRIDEKYFVDLFLENKKQAMDLGVNENNIFISNICTKCNNDLFYSYRVQNTTGRMGIFISL